jgi:hypothetical protein
VRMSEMKNSFSRRMIEKMRRIERMNAKMNVKMNVKMTLPLLERP